jgi:hypothetical protein
VWTACDSKGQFFNPYAYAGGRTNPIIFVDENGEWLGTVIGMVVGAYIGGVAGNNGELNPTKWENQQAWMIGAVGGAALGAGLEMANNYGVFEGLGNIKFEGNLWNQISGWWAMKGLQLSSTIAQNLIRELATSQRQTHIMIDRTAGNAYSHASNAVRFNPDLKTNYDPTQVTPKLAWQDRPPKVGLFHELVHSYHDVEGTWTADRTLEEERTVGIGNFSNTETYSENIYRQSISEPLRDRYYVP